MLTVSISTAVSFVILHCS